MVYMKCVQHTSNCNTMLVEGEACRERTSNQPERKDSGGGNIEFETWKIRKS